MDLYKWIAFLYECFRWITLPASHLTNHYPQAELIKYEPDLYGQHFKKLECWKTAYVHYKQ